MLPNLNDNAITMAANNPEAFSKLFYNEQVSVATWAVNNPAKVRRMAYKVLRQQQANAQYQSAEEARDARYQREEESRKWAQTAFNTLNYRPRTYGS